MNTTKYLSQGRLCSGRDSNRAPPAYKSRPTCSLWWWWYVHGFWRWSTSALPVGCDGQCDRSTEPVTALRWYFTNNMDELLFLSSCLSVRSHSSCFHKLFVLCHCRQSVVLVTHFHLLLNCWMCFTTTPLIRLVVLVNSQGDKYDFLFYFFFILFLFLLLPCLPFHLQVFFFLLFLLSNVISVRFSFLFYFYGADFTFIFNFLFLFLSFSFIIIPQVSMFNCFSLAALCVFFKAFFVEWKWIHSRGNISSVKDQCWWNRNTSSLS
jgi:hypothetical protein